MEQGNAWDVAQARAARGAELLDRQRPGWAGRINVKQLAMASGIGVSWGRSMVAMTEGVRR